MTNFAKEILPTAKIDDSQRWHLEGVLLQLGKPAESRDRTAHESNSGETAGSRLALRPGNGFSGLWNDGTGSRPRELLCADGAEQ